MRNVKISLARALWKRELTALVREQVDSCGFQEESMV